MVHTSYRLKALKLFFIPVHTRVPLKFGHEVLTSVTCARVELTVEDDRGRLTSGWGETPLSVQWVWPSPLPYSLRHERLKQFCRVVAAAWMTRGALGHPLESGYTFQEEALREALTQFNHETVEPSSTGTDASDWRVPWLAALVCNSPFDIALHDAFGKLVECPIYGTYGPDHLNHDLSFFLEAAEGSSVSFKSKYPSDYLEQPVRCLPAWHLVGGLDPLVPEELTGSEPDDGHPVLLADWIQRDGLKCLKVKLRGNDSAWDYARLVNVGRIAGGSGVEWLSADFNCTVKDPAYVSEALDRIARDHPRLYDRILYVEQPFPYDLESVPIDVHGVAARKPLFLDESAHDWRMVRFGRKLGWSGVALKTCKTQTGAILSACWAKAHGMKLMVQDLTNPMLAQVPHLLLAAHVGTIMGVETNAMQFYPAASAPEQRVHPGLYQRRNGMVDLSSIRGPGFGYRIEEIRRELPEPDLVI